MPSSISSAARAASWLAFLYIVPALGHMEISWPYPFRSRFNPDNDSNDIDYSMTSPLLADGSNFPCKGYQNDAGVQAAAEYTAGSTYNLTLAGSATHNGGSCQISLSYDNAATFRVIKSMIGGCPLTSTYDFTVPSYAPSGDALLAWTWQNQEGNREFYMNCAPVKVVSSSTRRRRARDFTSFSSLPYIWKANLEGVNDCATIEGQDPVYPHPGPDVMYSGKMSSSSTATSGSCDAATPYGHTYKQPANDPSDTPPDGNTTDTNTAPPTSSEESSTSPPLNVTETTSSTLLTSVETTDAQNTPAPTFAAKQHAPASPLADSTATTTTKREDAAFITLTPLNATSTAWATGVIRSAAPSPPEPTTPFSISSHAPPPYASSDANAHLPCVPGSFICTDATTWETCTSNDGSVPSLAQERNVYLYPRRVPAGMMCLPSYATHGSGSYRDDRIVRARPDGDCDIAGSLQCTGGGQQFEVCDQGWWVRGGSVAAGTICQNGQIVAATS